MKRYLTEIGTEIADLIFDKAQSGQLNIIYNIINTGEVIGILDKLNRLKTLSKEDFDNCLEKFFGETLRLLDLRTLYISPCKMNEILKAWNYIIQYHLYIVDALQLSTALTLKADLFVSGDKKLIDTAKKLDLASFDIETEQTEIETFINK